MPSNHEVTTNEILDYLAERMVTKEELKEVKEELKEVKEELKEVKEEFNVELRKSEQRTMDFITDKIDDLKGDLVVLTRKEDTKVLKLVEILKNKAVLSEADAKVIMSMEPFAKLYV